MIAGAHFRGGQKSISGEQDTRDDPDVEPLTVRARTEQTQQKDTRDTARENSIQREYDPQHPVGPRIYIQHGDSDREEARYRHDIFSRPQIMPVGPARSKLAIIIL